MSGNDGSLAYRIAFREGLRPEPDLTVSEWADRYRMLPQGSAEPGRYRTDRTPYLREIMDSLSPSSPIQRVVFMKSSQVGGSEAGNNWLGSIIGGLGAGPILLVQPTVDTAKRFSKQRIATMIESTPVIAKRVAENQSRDSSNTMLMKDFPGGTLVITGANSAVGLRSMPARYVMADELSAWPVDADGEGDPLQLAEKRTQTYGNKKKLFLVSTPGIKDVCRIEREFLESDQRRYYVPCPHCGALQWLQWKNLKWKDDDPSTAKYQCEHCDELIEERFKTSMLEDGEWRATATGSDKVRGYHISALYSPLGWKSWVDIVDEFLKCKADAALLKQWVNSILGETWEEEYSAKVGAEGLAARAEFYEPNTAPARALIVTAGVDVQDNRLAISLYGWGRDEEAWCLSHFEIFGDPAQAKVWKQLDEVLLALVPHEIAGPVPISAVAIDSGGHHTHEVYQYVRERQKHGKIFAVKGQSQRNKPAIAKATKVDVNFRGQTLKGGAEVYPMGSDTIKSVLYGRFKHNEPGPGYVHFHADLGPEFFIQITSEKQVTRYVKGFPVREWVKKASARNEALDCAVMAYCALQWLYMRFNRKTIWEQFERKLELKSENKTELKGNRQEQVQARKISPKGRGGFVSNF